MNLPAVLMILPLIAGSRWEMPPIVFHLTVITIAGGLAWLAVSQITRLRSNWQRQGQSPAALFAELCQAHGLTRHDRGLLAEASQTMAPAECCRVFIDSGILHSFARSNPGEAEECRTLMRKLYGRAD